MAQLVTANPKLISKSPAQELSESVVKVSGNSKFTRLDVREQCISTVFGISLQCTHLHPLLLDSKGEKIFDGHTTTKEVDFTTHIKPAHVYSFHVNLKAQPKEITLGGISHTKQSESLEAIVPCYSKPSKPLGR